jgi:hypothetical protein
MVAGAFVVAVPDALLLLAVGRADAGIQRRARARSNGRGYRAGRSLAMPCGFSFTRSPTISATSCARWQRPSRSSTGR